jgi:colanic acid/amylovoran biosynthesis glycosyltransferase
MQTIASQNEPLSPVIVFKTELLPISETFILAQANALRRFSPQFVGLRRSKPSLELPGHPIVLADGDGHLRRATRGLYATTGIRPGFHRRVREVGARLIHAHFAVGGLLALPLAESLDLPLIVSLHGSDITISDHEYARFRTGRLYLQRRQKLWERASLFVCGSEFLKHKALEAGFPEHKLRTLYIGVNHLEFRRTEGYPDLPSVLFVGRLVEKKGCDLLIHAMATVQQILPDVLLTIVGDGPMRRSLEELASALGVKCEFRGSCSSAQVKQMLERTSIFCGPSRTAANGDSEGLGIVFLEAQAMGIPVVSSLHGGIPEAVVHGHTGLLAPEGDYVTLAEHLRTLLLRKDLRVSYGSQGIRWVRQTFDVGVQTGRLEDAYEEVILAKTLEKPAGPRTFFGRRDNAQAASVQVAKPIHL